MTKTVTSLPNNEFKNELYLLKCSLILNR